MISRFITALLALTLLVSCGNTTASSGSSSTEAQQSEPKIKSVKQEFTTAKIIRKLPHSTDAYTQGLLIDGGKMYESTGEYGQSTLRRIDIESGKVEAEVKLANQYFGEGLALLKDKLYQLTWYEGTCFVYNAKTLKQERTIRYSGEGWGLVAYRDNLLLSDGSSTIKVVDPTNFKILSSFDVKDERGKVSYINELEMVDGLLYANIYTSPLVAVINPETGIVVKYIDCTPLMRGIGNAATADVLNGIAFDSVARKLYLTGKLWDTLFEIGL